MTDALPTETARQLGMRVRAGITDPKHASSAFMADISNEALAALDLLLSRLETITEERDEQKRVADSAFGKAEQYREAAVLAEQLQRDAETAAVVARSDLAGYKQLLEDALAETERLGTALAQERYFREQEAERAEATLIHYREAYDDAFDLVVWMSGSPTFGPGGEGHEEWVRRRDQLFATRAALESRSDP